MAEPNQNLLALAHSISVVFKVSLFDLFSVSSNLIKHMAFLFLAGGRKTAFSPALDAKIHKNQFATLMHTHTHTSEAHGWKMPTTRPLKSNEKPTDMSLQLLPPLLDFSGLFFALPASNWVKRGQIGLKP